MSSAKRKSVVVLPPILTVLSWSLSASASILSKMLKRVGESRHMYVCMYVYLYAYMYVCIYVCMYVMLCYVMYCIVMSVCMYVCM